MNTKPDPLLLILAFGAVMAGAVYAYVIHRRHARFEMFPLLEAMLAGAGATGAIHLLFCVFYPSYLIHLVDKDGKPIHPEGVFVKLDNWHAIEILVGGLAILVVSFIAFVRSCRH